MRFRCFAFTVAVGLAFIAFAFAGPAAFTQVIRQANAKPDGKPAELAKPVRVFILAGQSNTVGHSNGHTMCTLFKADGPKDQALTDLVFGNDPKLTKERFEEMLAVGRQLDELTGGAGDPKINALTDSASKAAAEAEAARMTVPNLCRRLRSSFCNE